MSVDSKLFVTCNKEDIINIGQVVSQALDEYSREVLDNHWKNNTDYLNRLQFLCSKDRKNAAMKFTNGVSIHSHNFDHFVFTFGSGDYSERMLSMFPTCSSDFNDTYEGHKVVFSLGMWGKYGDIMMVIAEAVKGFGSVFYKSNDCDDKDFVKLY